MQALSKKVGIVMVLGLTGLLLFWRFQEYFQFPSGKVIEPYGDGFKAYMTPVYHAAFDSTFSHFQGMNYPFGDHLIMADPQPILTNFIKLYAKHLSDPIGHTIAMTHMAMLASILLCSLFLYLIFQRLTLPVWYSVGAAIGISFLAPMVARMGYHYGLAQPAAIPAVLYLLLRFSERPRWQTSLWIALAMLVFSLFHFHYFALLFFTVSLFFGFWWLESPSWKKLLHLAPHYAVQALLPFALLSAWLFLTNDVHDRASQPWGFLFYRAHWEGLFTSMTQPHFRWLTQQVLPIRPLDVEAMNYIGLAATATFLALTGRWLIQKFRLPFVPAVIPQSHFLNRIFWSGLVLVLFAMGIPFIIPGAEGWIDFLGPLRQFRALGRFSWLFFFTANIVGFAAIWHYARQKVWLLTASLALLGFEARSFIRFQNLALDPVPALQNDLAARSGIDFSRFQAIVAVPYFNIGSDNFWLEPDGLLQQTAMSLSMQTGLPLSNVMLSRISLSQTLQQLQLVTEPYRKPAILGDYPSDKPLLLIWNEAAVRQSPLKWDHLLSSSPQLLFTEGELRFYALPLYHFTRALEIQRWRVQQEMRSPDLFKKGDFLLSQSSGSLLRQSWDDQPGPMPYQGKGGFSGVMQEKNVVFEGAVPNQQMGQNYLFSIWMYVNADLRGRTECTFTEYDASNGKTLQEVVFPFHRWVRVFDANGWAMMEYPFSFSKPGSKIRISFSNKTLRRQPLYLDELLIRPEKIDIYFSEKGCFWKNNRFYPDN